jgi:hypothetical protein
MVGKYVEPSISARSFNCPHCGAHATQTWFEIYCEPIADERGEHGVPWRPSQEVLDQIERDTAHGTLPPEAFVKHKKYLDRLLRGEVFLEPSEKHHYGLPQLENFAVSVCYTCKRPAVWLRDGVLYPPTRSGAEPSEDMPADVLADYDEARSIVMLSPRGAAALLRLAIQKLCDRLGEKGKKLDDALASLVQKGLDKRVQRALDIVRVIGNESVHPGQLDLRDDHDTATKLFGLVNLIVEKMISETKHVDEMYGGLPESKRKAIEERDKRGS